MFGWEVGVWGYGDLPRGWLRRPAGPLVGTEGQSSAQRLTNLGTRAGRVNLFFQNIDFTISPTRGRRGGSAEREPAAPRGGCGSQGHSDSLPSPWQPQRHLSVPSAHRHSEICIAHGRLPASRMKEHFERLPGLGRSRAVRAA